MTFKVSRKMLNVDASLISSICNATAAGTANALTATIPGIQSYYDGFSILVRATAANTSATPNININSIGAIPIVKGNNLPLQAGDIAGAGHWLELTYDAALTNFVLRNPGLSLVTGAPIMKMLQLAPKASTSGTFIDFSPTDGTGIPNWAKEITVAFRGVSTNGTSNILVRVGTSTSILTSGYEGATIGNTNSLSFTNGFAVYSAGTSASTHIYSGVATLTLQDTSANAWSASTAFGIHAVGNAGVGGGSIILPSVLDRIRITTVNGTDLFDAGSISVLVKGY